MMMKIAKMMTTRILETQMAPLSDQMLSISPKL